MLHSRLGNLAGMGNVGNTGVSPYHGFWRVTYLRMQCLTSWKGPDRFSHGLNRPWPGGGIGACDRAEQTLEVSMAAYAYEAVDQTGRIVRGIIDVANQSEALRRIKEMGFYPTNVTQRRGDTPTRTAHAREQSLLARFLRLRRRTGSTRVKPSVTAALTRQLATLVEAGMPLLRGLRLLQQEERNRRLRRVVGEIANTIEEGGTLTEALSAHPKVFNQLYINMVRAGEISGALDISLRRLAELLEKGQKLKRRLKAALVYPVAVLVVALMVLAAMTLFVIPRFQQVLEGLVPGGQLPPLTTFVITICNTVKQRVLIVGIAILVSVLSIKFAMRTAKGREIFDRVKLSLPGLGPVLRRVAIARLARTLGTLLANGVPILQALTIARDAVGNRAYGSIVSAAHENVKQGGSIAESLRHTRLVPPVIAGMVDVGEQTGALPDMLLKIADTCDDEVDNAVAGMTSLLEPVLIVFLATVVGGIVIAMFLPLITILNAPPDVNGFGS